MHAASTRTCTTLMTGVLRINFRKFLFLHMWHIFELYENLHHSKISRHTVAETKKPWQYSTVHLVHSISNPWRGWEVLASSPGSPVFSTYMRKEGKPGIKCHMINVSSTLARCYESDC